VHGRSLFDVRDGSLVLRPWRADDAPAVSAACQDPEIQRWLPLIPRPYTLEHARAYVSAPDGPYSFAVEVDGRVVGSISLRVDAHNATGTLGYWCAPEARGRGVTARALRLLCEYGLGELGLGRLELVADVDNAASLRVAEKVGFRREGILRSHLLHPDGRRRDDVMLSLLPGEL
jgi:RimJ/RimL family protein N-acetyltransferase